mmetsp:Transcript_81225/g.159414  ORF Transcript_81225/g.159414 Transcript_81225/m.159414 type:complete len:121 (+) Transcript_81225:123-485(+)
MIPKHGILSIIALWNPMMYIMGFGIINGISQDGKDNIIAGMVPSSQDSTNGQKEKNRQGMNLKVKDPTTQKQRPEMIVFSQDIFYGVYIDGIFIGTTGCLLGMMMFVNETINGLDMKGPM